jgi:aminoglycoside phosphotransferase (APT) family kinase protein
MLSIDSTSAIRTGEELDQNVLQQYLDVHLPNFGQIIEITQFPGGFSNLTYLVSTATNEYVLRRPPFGANIKSAHDMGREFRVLSLLKPHYSKIPQPTIYCEDESVMNAPFYMMERVKGIILRGSYAHKLQLEATQMKAMCEALIDNLAALHLLDIETTGLASLGKPEGYVHRQVEGWIGRYEKSKTDDIADMESAAIWMRANMPREQKPALIHNDYKYDNVVLNSENLSEILAVLDWEMATIGDPLMDLGAALGYWAEKGDGIFLKQFNITWLDGNLTRKEVVERYTQKTGRDLSDIVFYYAFGLYKNCVIMQQIYARWKAGLTKDPRFGALLMGVQELSKMATRAIDRGSV